MPNLESIASFRRLALPWSWLQSALISRSECSQRLPAAKELEKRRFMKNGHLDKKVDNEMKIMESLLQDTVLEDEEDGNDSNLPSSYVPFGSHAHNSSGADLRTAEPVFGQRSPFAWDRHPSRSSLPQSLPRSDEEDDNLRDPSYGGSGTYWDDDGHLEE
ncbi:hypothetical protein BU26DRAFT_560984 [Trematosphaeria pertusa]|uniref:Uncharacterized protein n=1 Tax=Trematosphaeria pertusa TaxID=390896 RepID=A0A6A6IT37_9PLEO|nr:uncharacterized protein BU26DRAFT_560984 [Trematosphaeria pertusa]KAF2253705.1 hypothetical protein BU26DRAFT_560984 [Trematosphaeria pertusa]